MVTSVSAAGVDGAGLSSAAVVASLSAPVVDWPSAEAVVGSLASVVDASLPASVVDASGLSLAAVWSLDAAAGLLVSAGALLASAEGLLESEDLARAAGAAAAGEEAAESLSDFSARPDFSPELLGATL